MEDQQSIRENSKRLGENDSVVVSVQDNCGRQKKMLDAGQLLCFTVLKIGESS